MARLIWFRLMKGKRDNFYKATAQQSIIFASWQLLFGRYDNRNFPTNEQKFYAKNNTKAAI